MDTAMGAVMRIAMGLMDMDMVVTDMDTDIIIRKRKMNTITVTSMTTVTATIMTTITTMTTTMITTTAI